MDLHPLIVHFPIALLTLYSVLEIIRRGFPRIRHHLQTTLLLLLVVGVLGGRMALRSGEEMAEPRAEDQVSNNLLEAHETFANTAMLLYGILLVVMLLLYYGPQLKPYLPMEWRVGLDVLLRILKKLDVRHIRQVLAVVAMGCLMITGALGGSMVYGPDIDPFTQVLVPIIEGMDR